MTQSVLAKAFRGELTADLREAVRNWKSLGLEERKKYVFTLPEREQEKALHSNTFPLEPAGRLLEHSREDRPKRGQARKDRKPRTRKKQPEQLKLW